MAQVARATEFGASSSTAMIPCLLRDALSHAILLTRFVKLRQSVLLGIDAHKMGEQQVGGDKRPCLIDRRVRCFVPCINGGP